MNFNTQKTFLRFATVLISTAGLSLVLGFFLFFKNINGIISAWGEVEKLTVYIDTEINKNEIETLRNALSSMDDVQTVAFVSKEEAIEEFNAQVAGYVKDLKKDINLMQVIPHYFEVSVKPGPNFEATIDKMGKLTKEIETLEDVEEISYGSIWIEKYAKFIEYITNIAGFIGIILISSTFLVISNLIKTNLYHRSREIEILEMIGATKAYIRKPFLIEGAIMSLMGGLISLSIIWMIFTFINTKFESQMKFFKFDQMFSFLNIGEAIGYIILTVFIGLLASYVNLIRFKWNTNQ